MTTKLSQEGEHFIRARLRDPNPNVDRLAREIQGRPALSGGHGPAAIRAIVEARIAERAEATTPPEPKAAQPPTALESYTRNGHATARPETHRIVPQNFTDPEFRVTRDRPCPICDKPDWCLSDHQAWAICQRTESGSRWEGAGFFHRLPGAPKPGPRGGGATHQDPLEGFAAIRRLRPETLRALDVAVDPDRPDNLIFPMVNDRAEPTGGARIRRADNGLIKLKDGKQTKALSRKGGRHGIFLHLRNQTGPMLLIEGELDAARAIDAGAENVIATPGCTPGREAWGYFARAIAQTEHPIIAFPDPPDDKDSAGKWLRSACKAAQSVGRELRYVPSDGRDLDDRLKHEADQGATLRELIGKAIPYLPPTDPGQPAAGTEPSRLDDIGNSERFARQYRGKIRYVPEFKTWYYFDGRVWREDVGDVRVTAFAKKTSRSIFKEAGRANEEGAANTISAWARKSAGRDRLKAMITLAASEPGMAASPEDFDADPWLFNTRTGTIDLKTGTLRAHDAEDLITKISDIRFDPKADAPRWRQFINEIFDNDAELTAYVRRLVGYWLSGLVSEQHFWVMIGVGANGKSVFIEMLKHLLGLYFHKCDPELFVESKNGRKAGDASPQIADLRGVRLAIGSETGPGRKLAETTVKELTGGDTLNARKLYGNPFQIAPTHKVGLITNHAPHASQDFALWRRMRSIPFNQVYDKDRRDTKLASKLKTELPGILNWAVGGCLEWQRIGLADPASVTASTEAYREREDIIGRFIRECCEIGPNFIESAKELFENYRAWCAESGEFEQSQKAFGTRLNELGHTTGKDPKTRRIVRIRLRLRNSAKGLQPDSGNFSTRRTSRKNYTESAATVSDPFATHAEADDSDALSGPEFLGPEDALAARFSEGGSL